MDIRAHTHKHIIRGKLLVKESQVVPSKHILMHSYKKNICTVHGINNNEWQWQWRRSNYWSVNILNILIVNSIHIE